MMADSQTTTVLIRGFSQYSDVTIAVFAIGFTYGIEVA
jgi:hypothetical protein